MSAKESSLEAGLSELGQQQRAERAELDALDREASELARQPPAASAAMEERLLREWTGQGAAVVPLSAAGKRARGWRWSGLAAAAALCLWIARASFAPAGLPAYSLLPPQPDAALRSRVSQPPAAGLAQVSLGRTLEFVLRPRTRHERAVHVSTFARREGERLRLSPGVSTHPGGAVALTVPTPGSPPLAAGVWSFEFYLDAEDEPSGEQACTPENGCLSHTLQLH